MATVADRVSAGADRSVDDVLVAICTFRREACLAALLESCRHLRISPELRVRFCVIDNDLEPTARDSVERFARDFPFPLRCVHEADAGIPSARNRALHEAGDSRYLAFVDDDETVHPDWLLELHRVMRATGAAFVQGRVELQTETVDDRWWLETSFFRQKAFADRAPRHESWTNNVMLDRRAVERAGCRFDTALRFDGGSDTLFFRDLAARAGHGRYAAHAIVYEVQPKSRLSWSWAIARQYRYGITRANVYRLRQPIHRALGNCALRSLAMMSLGALQLSSALVRGRIGLANGLALLARGAGVLLGGLGLRRREYLRETAA